MVGGPLDPQSIAANDPYWRARGTIARLERVTDDEAKRARAELRRTTWTGGVATFREMAAVDRRFWGSVDGVTRLAAMWSLVEDSLALQGHDGPTPRLQRAVGGVRRRTS